MDKGFGKDQKPQVPDRIRIEYMLRYQSKEVGARLKLDVDKLRPYVPAAAFQAMIFGAAGVRYKDELTAEKLFHHLKQQADASISLLDADFRDMLRPIDARKHEDYINLKEVRDLMLGYRASNNRLFMFGMANEGRLGVDIPGLMEREQSKEANFVKEIAPLTFVRFAREDDRPETEEVRIAKVQCGSSNTLALTTDGRLYSWGFGKSGSLGLGDESQRYMPTRIAKLADGSPCEKMIDISCGSSHSLAIDASGAIHSWGNGQSFRLGHGQPIGENAPR